mmetsp:Transcript_8382/g.12767  ORF Transcript_8382/g.12767 Transcript_8382/m.12767 type:complete len:105 (+) Transcript_8382:1019-1333(+)
MKAYNVPHDFYLKHESTFFKLIMNTVKDLSNFDIMERPEVDNAIDGVFRQNPSRQNIKVFFANEAIRGLWTNTWEGNLTSYRNSKFLMSVLQTVSQTEIQKFIR